MNSLEIRLVRDHGVFDSGRVKGKKWESFDFHEIEFDESGKPLSIATHCVSPCGDSLEGVKASLNTFLKAIEKPIIELEELERLGVTGT